MSPATFGAVEPSNTQAPFMSIDPCRNTHGCCTVLGYALRDWQQPSPRGTWRIAHKNNNCLVNTDG